MILYELDRDIYSVTEYYKHYINNYYNINNYINNNPPLTRKQLLKNIIALPGNLNYLYYNCRFKENNPYHVNIFNKKNIFNCFKYYLKQLVNNNYYYDYHTCFTKHILFAVPVSCYASNKTDYIKEIINSHKKLSTKYILNKYLKKIYSDVLKEDDDKDYSSLYINISRLITNNYKEKGIIFNFSTSTHYSDHKLYASLIRNFLGQYLDIATEKLDRDSVIINTKFHENRYKIKLSYIQKEIILGNISDNIKKACVEVSGMRSDFNISRINITINRKCGILIGQTAKQNYIYYKDKLKLRGFYTKEDVKVLLRKLINIYNTN